MANKQLRRCSAWVHDIAKETNGRGITVYPCALSADAIFRGFDIESQRITRKKCGMVGRLCADNGDTGVIVEHGYILQSYSSIVAVYDEIRDALFLLPRWDYSVTTISHVRKFCAEYISHAGTFSVNMVRHKECVNIILCDNFSLYNDRRKVW